MIRATVALLLLLSHAPALAAGLLRGRVASSRDNAPLPFATVRLEGTTRGARTDADGRFELRDVPPGIYNVTASLLGYQSATQFEIAITSARPVVLDLALDEDVVRQTDSIAVIASPFRRPAESPTSVRSIGSDEIERFPGGGRDVSKAIQSMPGVAGSPTFRNDILIRGGSPGENRFVFEGIRAPVINHFATQGSSGGPVGMIDVDLVQDVDLYTSALPAARGDALSSVMEFRLRNPNDERLASRLTLGASDLGLSLDGPLGADADVLLSLRRSYLQFVFKAIGLPFLPTYNDANLRLRWRPSDRDEVKLVGLGAIDAFELNEQANETEFQRYVLDQLPVTPQHNYSVGMVWKRFGTNGFRTLVASRSELDNRALKWFRNDASDPANLLLDYRSSEVEHELRGEWTRSTRRARWQYGATLGAAAYATRTYRRAAAGRGLVTDDYASTLRYATAAGYAQWSLDLGRGRPSVSAGLRADAADYNAAMRDPLRQLSPRAALSWPLGPAWRANVALGRYLQRPAATVLGFRDSTGRLVNRDAGIRPIRADHAVAGVERTLTPRARVSVEGFYKRYADYPLLVRDSISLANLGADFGVIGDAPVVPDSKGRSYGAEFLLQQRLDRGWYGIAAYTFVRSEFTRSGGDYLPSAWDNRHIVSVTGGRRLESGWQFGARWRLLGGAPYTPDDAELSSQRVIWDVTSRAVPDYRRLNARRVGTFHQLDVRVDKRWNFARNALELYLDIQNATAAKFSGAPVLTVQRDPASGAPLVDPGDPTRYLVKTLAEDDPAVFPTIGLRWSF